MPTVSFAPSIQRHQPAPPRQAAGSTLRQAMDAALEGETRLRGYVLDERGAIREHVAIFLDGRLAEDRQGLSDPVGEDTEIHVFQALSGG